MGASKRGPSRGPQNDSYNFRTKRGEFEWGGMLPDSDPGALPENRLRTIINGRFRGGSVVPRGGQTRFNASSLHSATARVKYLDDFQLGTKRSLYVTGNGMPGFIAGIGYYLGSYDFDQSPEFVPIIGEAVGTIYMGSFGDDIYIVKSNGLKKYTPIYAPYGTNPLDAEGLGGASIQDEFLVALDSGYAYFGGPMQEFDAALYAVARGAAASGVGTSGVFAWDGKTLRPDVTAINQGTGFGLYRESLLMGFDGTPNQLWVRGVGASPGTWTTFAPGAGTASFKKGVSYKDIFYFTTGTDDLYQFNGTTLTRIPRGTTGITAGSVTYGIAKWDGNLYFSYTVGGTAKIAKFDGSAWTAVHKNLTAQIAAVTTVTDLVEYRGSLVAAVTDDIPRVIGGCLMVSPPNGNTAGTWAFKSPDLAHGGEHPDTITGLMVF